MNKNVELQVFDFYLKSFKVNGIDCANYSIRLEEAEGVKISCKTCSTAKVEVIPGATKACFFVIAECQDPNSCKRCKVVKKYCIGAGGLGCEPCELLDPITGLCTDKCDGKLCDEATDTCVDCKNKDDCPNNQVCQTGKCECPWDLPYLGVDGYCHECATKEDCGPCKKCEQGVCKPIECANGGICNPEDDKCVQCIDNSQCTGPFEECKDNNKCDCIDGYHRDPATGFCVQNPPCTDKSECKACETCDPVLGCIPRKCPDNYICVPEEDKCVKKCECGSGPCSLTEACVKSVTGECYCKKCSGPCGSKADCGDGCGCDPVLGCVVDPCGTECNTGDDCGPGCGCKNKKCTKCSLLSCAECEGVSGCACTDGVTCKDVKDRCNPDNAGLKWTRECPSQTESGGNTTPLQGSADVESAGIHQEDPTHGGLYEAVTFSFFVDESVTGQWYYSPQGDSSYAIANATTNTLILTNNDFDIGDNIFGFKVIFEANDGRKISFNAWNANQEDPSNVDWQVEVASSYGTPPASGGDCKWKLCVTNPDFKLTGWNPQDEVFTKSEGKTIKLIVLEVTDTCVTFDLSGCGTYTGKLPIQCLNQTVLADIPLFNNNQCCDLHKSNCTGGPGDCVQTTKPVTLLAVPTFGGDGANDYFIIPKFSSDIKFEDLYNLTGSPFYTTTANNGINDITLDSSIGLDTGRSKLYKVVSLNNGGCVNFNGTSGCTLITGSVCIDKCTEFSLQVVHQGGSVYDIYPSHPAGGAIKYTIVAGSTRINLSERDPVNNVFRIIVDQNYQNDSNIIIRGDRNGCSAIATFGPDTIDCSNLLNVSDKQVDGNLEIYVNGASGKYQVTYTVTSGGVTGGPQILEPTDAEITTGALGGNTSATLKFTVPTLQTGDIVKYVVKDLGTLCEYPGDNSQAIVTVEDCVIGLTVTKNAALCQLEATTDYILPCSCTENAKAHIEASSLYLTDNGDGTVSGEYAVDIEPIIGTYLGGVVESFKVDVGSVVTKTSGNSIIESKPTIDVPGGSSAVTFTYAFTKPEVGRSATVKIAVKELKLSNGCVYDALPVNIEYTHKSNGSVVIVSEILAYDKNFASRTQTGEKPEFMYVVDGAVVKREYGVQNGSQYKSTLSADLFKPYNEVTISVECGCTNTKYLQKYCLDPTLTVGDITCVSGKENVSYTFNGCFPGATVYVDLARINNYEGTVVLATEVITTNSQGNYSGSIAADLDPEANYTLIAYYLGADTCKATAEFTVPALFSPIPEYTCNGTSDYDVTLPDATAIDVISSTPSGVTLGMQYTDTLSAVTNATEVEVIPYGPNGCPGPQITLYRDCNCDLSSVSADNYDVCKDASSVLIDVIAVPTSTTDYEYSFDDATYADLDGNQIDVVGELAGTPGDLTVGDNTLTVYVREKAATSCKLTTQILVTVNDRYTIDSVSSTCGSGSDQVTIDFESDAPLNKLYVGGQTITLTGTGTSLAYAYRVTDYPAVGGTLVQITAGSGLCITTANLVAPTCTACTASQQATVAAGSLIITEPCDPTPGRVQFTAVNGASCAAGSVAITPPSGWSVHPSGGWIVPATFSGTAVFQLTSTCGCITNYNVPIAQNCVSCSTSASIDYGCGIATVSIIGPSNTNGYKVVIQGPSTTQTYNTVLPGQVKTHPDGYGTYNITITNNDDPTCIKNYSGSSSAVTGTLSAQNNSTCEVTFNKTSGTCSEGFTYRRTAYSGGIIVTSDSVTDGGTINGSRCNNYDLEVYCGNCLVASGSFVGGNCEGINTPTGSISSNGCAFSTTISGSKLKPGTYVVREQGNPTNIYGGPFTINSCQTLNASANYSLTAGQTKTIELVYTPTVGSPSVLATKTVTCPSCASTPVLTLGQTVNCQWVAYAQGTNLKAGTVTIENSNTGSGTVLGSVSIALCQNYATATGIRTGLVTSPQTVYLFWHPDGGSKTLVTSLNVTCTCATLALGGSIPAGKMISGYIQFQNVQLTGNGITGVSVTVDGYDITNGLAYTTSSQVPLVTQTGTTGNPDVNIYTIEIPIPATFKTSFGALKIISLGFKNITIRDQCGNTKNLGNGGWDYDGISWATETITNTPDPLAYTFKLNSPVPSGTFMAIRTYSSNAIVDSASPAANVTYSLHGNGGPPEILTITTTAWGINVVRLYNPTT